MRMVRKRIVVLFFCTQALGILCGSLANVHSFAGILLLPALVMLFPGVLIGGVISQNWLAILGCSAD